MVTQSEVADRAGVSFITVSRVINGKGNVKEETRQKVLEAIKALKYYPNSLARGLNINKINTIGVVIPTSAGVKIHETQFNIDLLIGIEGVCSDYRYDLLIPTKNEKGGEQNYLNLYYERKADGLIFITPDLEELQIDEIVTHNIPCVVVADRPGNYISYVDSDNFDGAVKVMEYLIENGHRKIAFLRGDEESRNSNDRLAGFMSIVEKYGLEIPENWILLGNYSVQGGRNAIKQLFKSSEPPTALFCANDLMAIGALTEAQQNGIKVPENLSIAGFDGIETIKYIHPALTTVKQSTVEMGKAAAEILFRRINGESNFMETRIYPVEFITGGSVQNINKGHF